MMSVLSALFSPYSVWAFRHMNSTYRLPTSLVEWMMLIWSSAETRQQFAVLLTSRNECLLHVAPFACGLVCLSQ